MSLKEELQILSLQSMVLTMALRRKLISTDTFKILSAEAAKYFGRDPTNITAAWQASAAAENVHELGTEVSDKEIVDCIQVVVDKKFIRTQTGSVVMLLRDKTSGSAIPMIIGALEANAILMELENAAAPRPLTPDLVKNILIDQFGAAVTKAVITETKIFGTDETFYARLYIESDGRTIAHDSRPGDAIAIALRFGAPILIKTQLWAEILASDDTAQLLDWIGKVMEKDQE